MTYNEISQRLFDGSLCPEEAKCNALKTFDDDCQLATKRWAYHYPQIIEAANVLLKQASEVVRDDYYLPCLKAGFFAALFSYTGQKLVTDVENTRPPFPTFDCRLGEWNRTTGTCTRVASGISGDRYDNCLSVHAAQWLEVPQGYHPHQLLWMEAGAVLHDGKYALANSPQADPLSRVYRCSMCLKTMAGKGIMDLCNVGMDNDGNVLLTIAPIADTLSTLVICNLADMMLSKIAT